MRVDLKTNLKLSLVCYEKGRIPVKVILRFKNFYLYSSVNSADGISFILLLPSANTDCMNIFLEELSTINQEDFILIMEGAVCHKSRI